MFPLFGLTCPGHDMGEELPLISRSWENRNAAMKAIRIHAYGDASVLAYEDAPRPTPADNQILVRVHAAGVNPIDWKIRSGALKDWIPKSFPFVPGVDFSGVVEAAGSQVQGLEPGNDVFGEANVAGPNGSYAEYLVVTAKNVALKPRSIDHVQAAALPVVATTAWQALFGDGSINLQPGQTILIHGGAGGVGSMAVQFAKWRGAEVIATASGANQDYLRQLGATRTIDYTKGSFETEVREADAVLDTVGGETQARSWAVLKRGGTLASIVGEPSQKDAAAHGARAVQVQGSLGLSALNRIAELVDAGALKPQVNKVLPLAEARKAHELSEAGHVRGKIVLRVMD
jgi:NADPH:quinone reductase-like Zn-dependent oxidoreductase